MKSFFILLLAAACITFCICNCTNKPNPDTSKEISQGVQNKIKPTDRITEQSLIANDNKTLHENEKLQKQERKSQTLNNPVSPIIESKDDKSKYDNSNSLKKCAEMNGSYVAICEEAIEPYDANSKYNSLSENTFLNSMDNPLSTFSIDVDTASYSNSRRWLQNGQLPTKGVVRTEEFINYFNYDYPSLNGNSEMPFSVYTEAASCPWAPKHQILQIGLRGKEMKNEGRKPSNLVFLIDVSGSMNSPDKLPLLKNGLKMLVNQLKEEDSVAITVYAGASGLALEATSVKEKSKILNAIEQLNPGGSTNGAAGIHLAYEVAEKNFKKDGNNRVILATDGDFNVGTTSTDALQSLIEEKRKSGVFLSVLGFGTGNLNDHMMETIANKGNGNYFYIDTLAEAQKVLVEQLSATLYTIAKDVKIQIEFNPDQVAYYRLIGYENRKMAAEDFNNDKKDAGEIGAGHTVTALYEIVPVGIEPQNFGGTDELKYQVTEKKKPQTKNNSDEVLTLKIRYKKPDEDVSSKQVYIMKKNEFGKPFSEAKNNLTWSTAVAAFAQKLNNSDFIGKFSYEDIEAIAKKAKGDDPEGYRGEMIRLIKLANKISPITSSK